MVVIDKRTLTDSITIQKVGAKDDWGKKEYLPPVYLNPVRFDRSFDAPGTVNNPAGKKNPSYQKPGVIFVYPQYCPVELDESYREGIVKDGSREYIVTKILPIMEPLRDKVYCYEIEVM